MNLSPISHAATQHLHLVIISDSEEKRQTLADALGETECGQPDLAVVDVEPSGLTKVLARLRNAEMFADVPVLVASGRLGENPRLAGVLPQYRAMPCAPDELVALVRRRAQRTSSRTRRSKIL